MNYDQDINSLNTIATMIITTMLTQIYKEKKEFTTNDFVISCMPFISVMVPLVLKYCPWIMLTIIYYLKFFLMTFLNNCKFNLKNEDTSKLENFLLEDTQNQKHYSKQEWDLSVLLTEDDFDSFSRIWYSNDFADYDDEGSHLHYLSSKLGTLKIFNNLFDILTDNIYVQDKALYAIKSDKILSFNVTTSFVNRMPKLTGYEIENPIGKSIITYFCENMFESDVVKNIVKENNKAFENN